MNLETRPLKLIIWLQLGVGFVFSVLLGLYSFQLGASFAVGVLLMVGNVIVLSWAWARILAQKRIAWTVLIIVIKYAVLLSSIFYLAQRTDFSLVSAGFGISSLVISALLWAVFVQKEKF